MLNLIASTQAGLSAPEQMKLYRGFLGLTQAQLAEEMGTTQTSVGRWESGISPISAMTMSHLRKVVEVRIMIEARPLFKLLVKELGSTDFGGVGGIPQTDFRVDGQGALYLGAYFIDGYRKHSFHLRVDDRRWCGLDGDGRAVIVDEAFLSSLVPAGKTSKKED